MDVGFRLMTGLMVIFLFIAVAYMIQVKENQTVLTDYVETKTKLHDKLVAEFKDNAKRWDMSVGKDLSMRFNNPTVMFAQGSAELTPQFKKSSMSSSPNTSASSWQTV